MRSFQHAWTLLLLGLASPGLAHDLSLLSGFYKSDKIEDGLERSEISLGSRYALRPTADQSQWFVRVEVASVSYSGPNAPDGATNFRLGAGKLYFIKKLSGDIRSYLSWDASFVSNKESLDGNSEVETTGLLYGGHAGFRFDLTKAFYFEIDAQLFESALTSTETTRSLATPPGTDSKRTRLELFAKSFSGVEDIRFGLGYIF